LTSWLDCSTLVLFSQWGNTVYHRLNAQVMLQPISAPVGTHPYMAYFGSNRNSDGSHIDTGQTPEEWYSTYYLQGVEWANIVSPRAKDHILHSLQGAVNSEIIQYRELSGGGILLKSAKPILACDVADAIELKKIVEDALYPGGRAKSVKQLLSAIDNHHISYLPRNDWAIVPIYPEEIEFVGENLVFRSGSKKYFCFAYCWKGDRYG